jgi:hypothetical protein
MIDYMLDTNIYDLLLHSNIDTGGWSQQANFYITNIQISEIKNIPDADKQTRIFKLIEVLNPKKLNLVSGIWLDDIYWDDEQPWIDNVSDDCLKLKGNTLDAWKDAHIGEIALNNGMTLITNDGNFRKKADKAGVTCLTYPEFLERFC